MLRPPVVLGYHGIADVDPRHDPVRLFVSPERLRSQLATMVGRGYGFVTMAEFSRGLIAGTDLRGTAALTFDDGTLDHLTELLPILEEHKVTATVYVCPGLFGSPYPWCDPAAGVRMMTADEVVDLGSSALIEIGSHTVDHAVLGRATADEASAAIVPCKEQLENLLGVEVPSFCYPRCVYSAAAQEAVRMAGHTNAVTCGPRGSWDPFEIKRETVHTPDGRLTFSLKSRGLYYGVRDLPPARFARWATRPYRHRAERD